MPTLRRTLAGLAILAVAAHAAPLQQQPSEDLADWTRNFAGQDGTAHPLNRRASRLHDTGRYRLVGAPHSADDSVDALLLPVPSSSTPEARLDAPEKGDGGRSYLGKRQAFPAAGPLAAAASSPVAQAAAASSAVAGPLAAAAVTSPAAATTAAVAASPAVAATSNLVAAASTPATTIAKPTTSAASTAPSSSASRPASSSSKSASSSSSSKSPTSSPSTGFTLTDVNNKLYPLWVSVVVCGVLFALFFILICIRCCFFKPHEREDLDSVLTGSSAGAMSRKSTLRNGAKSLRKALTRRKLAGSSFVRRQQEGSVLLEVGDEVFAVPPKVAEEYNEAKRMFAPRNGVNDATKWNGKAYLAQCLVRHENQRNGVPPMPSRLIGAQNDGGNDTRGWSRSSLGSTLIGHDDEDKEKSAYEAYMGLSRTDSQKPKRGLSARIAESIRSLRTQGSSEDEIEKDDRLGEPTRTTDLTNFLNGSNNHGANTAGWGIQVHQDADDSITMPRPAATDYQPARNSIVSTPRSAPIAAFNARSQDQGRRPVPAAMNTAPNARGGFSLEDAPSPAARARVTENKRRSALPPAPINSAPSAAPAPFAVQRKPLPQDPVLPRDIPTVQEQQQQPAGAPAQAPAPITDLTKQQSRHQRAVSTPHVAFASKTKLDSKDDDEEAVFLRRHPTASSVSSSSSASSQLKRTTGTTRRASRHASMASSTTSSRDRDAVQRSATMGMSSSASAPQGLANLANAGPPPAGRDRLKEMRLAQSQARAGGQQGRRHVSAAVVPQQTGTSAAEGLSRSSTTASPSRHRDQKMPRRSVAGVGGEEVPLARGV
ncbi:hypothetical protein BDZ90DRAFT_226811 [Jaminaea rosea]|uniref:Uncharacterized protein n=1 Tax=Jaminaea rosea TaxID=1569628 RepID=A0A316URX8_9BASI|nr:hypothetical protein BDZ90DRAFT_226811 [Jaminaea rosea]PWN28037.1 hypothetical protein BDZ90DRAFT_226811 [Jaminaea rosea]